MADATFLPATAAAENLLDVDRLRGDATFTNIEIGRDAGTFAFEGLRLKENVGEDTKECY